MISPALHFSTLLNSLLEGMNQQGNPFRWAWDRLRSIPLGDRIYSKLLSRYVPYTGSISPRVIQLDAGYARVEMADRHELRNHLDCLHAVALTNLLELTGNIALGYSLPTDARFIIKGFQVEFLKKARGTITAECRCPIPKTNAQAEYLLEVQAKDSSGELVTRCTMTTVVGPQKVAAH